MSNIDQKPMALAMLKELFAHKCESKYGREIQRKVQAKQVKRKMKIQKYRGGPKQGG